MPSAAWTLQYSMIYALALVAKRDKQRNPSKCEPSFSFLLFRNVLYVVYLYVASVPKENVNRERQRLATGELGNARRDSFLIT